MPQATEDRIYGLIVQAQEMQKFCLEFKGSAEKVVKSLPDVARNAVRDAASEIITEGTEQASKALLGASTEALAAAKAIRSAHIGHLLFSCAVVVVVALIACAAVYGGMGYLADERRAELKELERRTAIAQRTLDELEAKTWGIELAKDSTQRWIILPKGRTFGKTGDMQDGRKAIFVQ